MADLIETDMDDQMITQGNIDDNEAILERFAARPSSKRRIDLQGFKTKVCTARLGMVWSTSYATGDTCGLPQPGAPSLIHQTKAPWL